MKAKKLASFVLVFAMAVLVLPRGFAKAENSPPQNDIIFLENGDHIEIIMESMPTRATGTTTKRLNYNYYDINNGEIVWQIILTGVFEYNGTTATCTSSSCSVDIYDSSWYVISKSVSKSGDAASATVEMGRKVLGVTIKEETYRLSLTCDKNGNVS